MTRIRMRSGVDVMVGSLDGRVFITTRALGLDPVLTPAEARRMAAAVVAEADRIDGGPTAWPYPELALAVLARVARGEPADVEFGRELARRICSEQTGRAGAPVPIPGAGGPHDGQSEETEGGADGEAADPTRDVRDLDRE